MKTKVTIGVCVKDCATSIKKAIESIITQDYPHELMEIIIVDDGSKDETFVVLNNFISKIKPQVKVFRHKWKGLGYSRNVVVKNAQGKYIIWVDCDMIIPSDHVRKHVEFMEKNPKIGIAKARHGIMHKECNISVLEKIPFLIHDLKDDSFDSKLPGTGGAIYRVEAIRQVGGFDNKIKGAGEDQDIAFRIKEKGWIISRSPAIFFEIRARTYIQVWKRWFWYGLHNYSVYRKNRKILSPFRMNPIAGFIRGFFYIADAYRLLHKKILLLLPFHMAFEATAWWFGFVCSQLKSG